MPGREGPINDPLDEQFPWWATERSGNSTCSSHFFWKATLCQHYGKTCKLLEGFDCMYFIIVAAASSIVLGIQ